MEQSKKAHPQVVTVVLIMEDNEEDRLHLHNLIFSLADKARIVITRFCLTIIHIKVLIDLIISRLDSNGQARLYSLTRRETDEASDAIVT
ncbi:hypothetical protein HAX54_004158, partial [Datura stramonium]|nr:hypothetical protein [Datura stramonium]